MPANTNSFEPRANSTDEGKQPAKSAVEDPKKVNLFLIFILEKSLCSIVNK